MIYPVKSASIYYSPISTIINEWKSARDSSEDPEDPTPEDGLTMQDVLDYLEAHPIKTNGIVITDGGGILSVGGPTNPDGTPLYYDNYGNISNPLDYLNLQLITEEIQR